MLFSRFVFVFLSLVSICVFEFVLHLSFFNANNSFCFGSRKKTAYDLVQMFLSIFFPNHTNCFRILLTISLTVFKAVFASLRRVLEHSLLSTDSRVLPCCTDPTFCGRTICSTGFFVYFRRSMYLYLSIKVLLKNKWFLWLQHCLNIFRIFCLSARFCCYLGDAKC